MTFTRRPPPAAGSGMPVDCRAARSHRVSRRLVAGGRKNLRLLGWAHRFGSESARLQVWHLPVAPSGWGGMAGPRPGPVRAAGSLASTELGLQSDSPARRHRPGGVAGPVPGPNR